MCNRISRCDLTASGSATPPGLTVTGLHFTGRRTRYLRDAPRMSSRRAVPTGQHPHSCAIIEAREDAELADVLGREFEPAPVRSFPSALTSCDVTTSPDGELHAMNDGAAQVTDRYGPGHQVSRVDSSAPCR